MKADAFLKARDDGRLVSFKLPNSGGLALSVERHMLEQAMDYWHTEQNGDTRQHVIQSVREHLKAAIKRMKRGKMSDKEYDDLASDACLWLGFEMVYADGEKHLVDARKIQLPQ